MIPAEVIARKRDGNSLSADQIHEFITGFTKGVVPDYQMAALAMAIFFQGMTREETVTLTQEMLDSGDKLNRLASNGRPRVDKHSTGGIGDKVSLILAPLLASCGLDVPMISGRGLGPTGGTLDKLEAIPGFRTNLSIDEFDHVLKEAGCVIAGASQQLAPADAKLYALRDVTATVESVPLITSSILSKKLAEQLDALVLDVKFGNGAFMKSQGEALELAESLVSVSNLLGTRSSALITDMNQPLGQMIGNAVEVNESIDTLKGNGPADLVEVTLNLGAEVLVMQEISTSRTDAIGHLERVIASGEAMERFARMVNAQGGNVESSCSVDPTHEIVAQRDGHINQINAGEFGQAIIGLGGGRRKKTDKLKLSSGIQCLVRVGEKVDCGQPLLRIFSPTDDFLSVKERLETAIEIGDETVEPLPLIVDRIINGT